MSLKDEREKIMLKCCLFEYLHFIICSDRLLKISLTILNSLNPQTKWRVVDQVQCSIVPIYNSVIIQYTIVPISIFEIGSSQVRMHGWETLGLPFNLTDRTFSLCLI